MDLLRSGLEVYVQAANKTAKTTLGATLAVAWLRGLTFIDGRTIREAQQRMEPFPLELPPVPSPCTLILTVPSYKQSAPSTIGAILNMIGKVPHAVEKVGPQATAAILVKPDGSTSDDPATWSRLYVFPSDGELPYGIRAHGAIMDEPTTRRMWTEVRNRGFAGLPFHRLILLTPIDLDKVQWLREDFDGAQWPETRDGRTNFRLNLEDNEALSAEDIRRAKESNRDSLWADAILRGDYVNVSMSNPFKRQADALKRWRERCRKPVSVLPITVASEVDTREGRVIVPQVLNVEFWADHDPRDEYLVIGDPSLGVDDKEHDPCGMHVWARRSRRLVARYNGFSGAYALGWIMALMGEAYGDAQVDVDVTGGYGGATLSALAAYRSARHSGGYRNFVHDPQTDRPGAIRTPLGFTMDEWMKAEMLNDVEQALAGDAVDLPSEAAVRCLMEAVVDVRQKLAKPAGVHYEDLILLGRFLRLLRMRPPAPIVETAADVVREMEEVLGVRTKPRSPWEPPEDF